jgi:hypothetical protein
VHGSWYYEGSYWTTTCRVARTRSLQMANVAEKGPEIMFSVSPLLVRVKTAHNTAGRPMIIPPPMRGVRSTIFPEASGTEV